jgi:nucleoside-diphosphate-sugar epimerase
VDFVTGDSGFIGTFLTSALLRTGREVSGLDLLPKASSAGEYPHRSGTILDKDAVLQAMHGCTSVIHLAAEHKDAGISRERYHRANVEGTRNILDCAADMGIRNVVFFSSVAVYGDQVGPTEADVPRPSNHYGESKLLAEHAVMDWTKGEEARSAIIIRPTVVFGPWSKANIFKLIRYVCDGKFVWVGSGENVKSIAYIKNLIAATTFLLERAKPGVEVYNYSDEPQLRTQELVSLIAKVAEVREPRLRLPLGPALAVARLFDLVGALTGRDLPVTTARLRKFNATTLFRADKIRAAGFVPPYSIEQGIFENVRWYLDEYKPRTTRVFDSYDH